MLLIFESDTVRLLDEPLSCKLEADRYSSTKGIPKYAGHVMHYVNWEKLKCLIRCV